MPRPPRPLAWIAAAWLGLLGTAGAERREVHDRHGHVLLHMPPLWRDAACAPDLFGAVRRAGRGGEARPALPGEGGGALAEPPPIATVLDGGVQVAALQALQGGVLRLSRTERPVGAISGKLRVAEVLAVEGERVVLDLGRGARATMALPMPSCPGHEAPPAERPRPGERLRVRVDGDEVTLQPQAALVALDPRTRDVLAWAGGAQQRPGDFDRALQGRRQAGSTWKPLVYAAALASGRWHADDEVEDLPRAYSGWRPRNFSGTYQGRLTLRQALAQSVNTVAVHLISEVGTSTVAGLAGRLGIPAEGVPRDLTQALGTALVSPLQLAGAYAVFAGGSGRYVAPRMWASDADLDTAGEAALPAEVAAVMDDLLQGVVREGSAARARELGRPGLGGKTGTTSHGNDAWFVGYGADLLAAVWVGDDEPADGDGHGESRTGAEAALPLWMDFMRRARP